MASKKPTNPHTRPAKQKPPAATETSQSIEEQVQAFLKAGGEIQRIATGVTGQKSLSGPKHIVLGNKPRNG